jgi:NAD(P)-dependent dehydrogenase (short-subunit alcohol dehydrogenase family)
MYKEPTIEDWEKSFQADILGLVNLINASAPYLEKRNGSIVVISSLAGFETKHPAIRGPYTTMKRAQATLAKDFGRWLAPRGIRINTIVPGAIDPPPVVRPDGTEEPSLFQQATKAKPGWLEELISSIPLGEVGQGQDIANAVVFLGSRLSKYISGVNLIVDGGMSTAL